MKSWKSTLLGAALAALLYLQPLLQNGSYDLKRDWPKFAAGALIAFLGYFTKDKNVTGGTTPQ